MFLKAANLSSLASVSHAFFTRNGGVSGELYTSLNCGRGSKDSADNVGRNRVLAAKALGAHPHDLLSLYQVHGNTVIIVTDSWDTPDMPKADAMVTDRPGIALGILTADCVPVLFACKKRKIIGAAHAGWKGTFAGIIQETLNAMAALGAGCEDIAAAIGPAIAQSSYEVDAAFRDIWTERASANSRYFLPSTNAGHFLFDLKGCVHDILQTCGIRDINMLENDTYIEEDAFFSYRRTTHRSETDYGRQLSAIMIRTID